ncbi:tetraacyldisaccharide 4'-kinase [Campylobacter mucosalis]|uniref:tetraacyldisaccharide 4'-kinase n=1 Tax=Campylobacter mucosalis TaxID=202 RepID=UPI0015944670|nr:tetraacyldisaccharide 4'-kinase [Campylobacter mucosalis]QKF62854.1 tetraacyldisaccharide 4'-kinase [Campylobacter mucosalis]
MFNKAKFHAWADDYFYRPNFIQKLVSILLLPLCAIYSCVVCLKQKLATQKDFGIKILSIGNLSLGGSGKTPLGIAIANEFSGAFIILRGYKRQSKGLVKVALNGEILTDVKTSGDEAMEYATSVKNANVIVSENRDKAIFEAKNLGAKYILLDDGFSKFHIKKFNILIRPNPAPKLNLTIPSGGYRYPVSFYKFANFIAEQDRDYFRYSEILNPTPKMVLVTAIANPLRLEPFFYKTIAQVFFEDHHAFTHQELEQILKKYNATSLLMTKKDFVKAQNFGIKISLISLKTELSQNFKNVIKTFLL